MFLFSKHNQYLSMHNLTLHFIECSHRNTNEQGQPFKMHFTLSCKSNPKANVKRSHISFALISFQVHNTSLSLNSKKAISSISLFSPHSTRQANRSPHCVKSEYPLGPLQMIHGRPQPEEFKGDLFK